MKHRNSHFVVGYWGRIKGAKSVPDQADIDPRALKRLLPFVFLLETGGQSGALYRLAGTTLCHYFGHELRDAAFLSHWDEGSKPALSVLLRQAERLSAPICLVSLGATDDGRMVEIETALMPIAHSGRARFLGVISVLGDAGVLAGRNIVFQRLVSSTMVHEDGETTDTTPPSFGQRNRAPTRPTRVPHLRLVVPQRAAHDPLRLEVADFDGFAPRWEAAKARC
ncbi:MAG: PAS domain-containing protein [Alphaproteobacteria bacterium]